MHFTPVIAAAISLATFAKADFDIYHMNTISGDPYLPGGYKAIFNNQKSMNCDEVGDSHSVGWVGDASDGGVRCEGCPFDADSIDDWNIKELEFKNDGLISWKNKGWITLRPKKHNKKHYYLEYVNAARTESGIITHSWCERDGSTEISCTGPDLANSNVKKLFKCHSGYKATENPGMKL